MAEKVPYKVVFYIKNNLDKTDKEIGLELGLASSTIAGIRRRKGLKKSNDGRFKPGQKPIYVNRKANSGSFKKGNIPFIKYPDGITVQLNNGRHYKWIRIGEGKRKLLHRFVWEKHHGKITSNTIVSFKDGNSMNCELDNLFLKSRTEHLRDNENRKKAAAALKKVWNTVKLFEANGIKHSYKFKSKRVMKAMPSINTDVNKHINF